MACIGMRLKQHPNMKYLSFHEEKTWHSFGKSRIVNHLSDLWMSQQLKLDGITYESQPPPLSPAEISAIPGADVANGRLDALQLKVCVRAGEKIAIHEDSRREWSSTSDSYADQFKRLDELHKAHYIDGLASLLKPPAPGSSPGRPPVVVEAEEVVDVADAVREGEDFENIEALQAARPGHKVEVGPSEVGGVSSIFVSAMAADGLHEVYLMSTDGDKTLPGKTRIGSYGGGSYVNENPNEAGIPFHFPLGDKTLVEYEADDKIKVMTFYSMIRAVENTGCVTFNVSHLTITRDSSTAAQDTVIITHKTPKKIYKFAAGLLTTEVQRVGDDF